MLNLTRVRSRQCSYQETREASPVMLAQVIGVLASGDTHLYSGCVSASDGSSVITRNQSEISLLGRRCEKPQDP